MKITKKMVEDALRGWAEYKPNYKKKCKEHENDSEYDIYSCLGCRMEQALNAALKGKS